MNRDQLLKAKRRTVVVDLPDREIKIRLRALSYKEMEDVPKDPIAQLALSIVDDEGNVLFTSPEGIEELKGILEATDIAKLMEAFGDVCGVSKRKLEEFKKNFSEAPSADSASASQ